MANGGRVITRNAAKNLENMDLNDIDLGEIIRNAISDAVIPLKDEIMRLKDVIVKLEHKVENMCCNNVSKVLPDDTNVVVEVNKEKTVSNAQTSSKLKPKNTMIMRPITQLLDSNGSGANNGKSDVDPKEDDLSEGDSFQVVNRRKPRKFIIGKKQDDGLLVAQKEVHLHIWRLSPSTTEDDLTNYIKKSLPDLEIACSALKARGNYASFKVTTLESAYDDLISPDFWPNGVAIDRFFNYRSPAPKLT